MMKKHSQSKHSLLCAFLLFVLCSGLANSQQNDACDYRFLTVNTFGDLSAVNISCFGDRRDCTVYYAAPGTGCYEDSLTRVATIPQGKTKSITYDLPYGSGLCSNNQTSVQVGDDFTAIAQLPRATQAGKMFHTTFDTDTDRSYKCSVSALASLANVKYSLTSTDIEQVLLVPKYRTLNIEFDTTIQSSQVLKIVSDVSVIVSCLETTSSKPQLIVLEPISSQPLMIVTPINGYFQFTVANCSTNEKISDASNVTWIDSVISDYSLTDCSTSGVQNKENLFFTWSLCVISIIPKDNETCVSAVSYASYYQLSGVGLTELKLTKQFISYPYQQVQFYFAFSPTTCSSAYGKKVDTLKLKWLPGSEDDKAAGAATGNFLDKYDSVKCTNPVYLFFHGIDHYVAFRSGFQSYDMWTPFFKSENCKLYPPTPAPSKGLRSPFGMGSISALLVFCSYFVLL